MTFTPLRVRSHGSLLHGTASPRQLIARALELGYTSLALTDLDNLYLAVPFYLAARPEGLSPILGAEITRPDGARASETLLLPLDRRGWANLCAVISARHLDPAFDVVRALAEHWDGLHVIVESAPLAAALLRAGVPRAAAADQPERVHRRAGGVWLGIRGVAAERTLLVERAAAARRLDVPLVATGHVAMLHARDRETHRVAVTAAAGELLERMPEGAFAPAEAWLAPPAEWERRVRVACAAAGVPEVAPRALANNAALVERCRCELETGTPIFPRAPLPEGVSGMAHLQHLALEGLRRRGLAHDLRARARLRQELGVIDRLGFTDYFLLVAEIVGFARAHDIPTVGRGSGASSIVAYALGITNVDPIRYGLSFERFLHPQRRDCPDLDIDLCWKRRDEVIAHVYATHGHDRVAMIATHATLGARSAFRETAKALGVPNARVNALAKRIPHAMAPPYLQQLEQLPESRAVAWHEPPLPDALALAERLDGAPRHLSIHCGGIVIADRPLTYYVPLQRAAKEVVVTQFEMRAIEAVGLVKMDLLGNRALSTIGECITLARAGGEACDLETVPEDDARAAQGLAVGDTLNCFQLESPAMRHLLQMLQARTLDEVIAAVALVRPGAAESGMKEAFCRRHRGLEPAAFTHPLLAETLRDTHGVMLYEEDVMRVAQAITGMSLAEGDDLRRAIGAARGDEEFRALERGFVSLAARRGVDHAGAVAVWRDLTRFAAYAFCKAHAAGYGTLGWQSAVLRARLPAAWAVGILNHHAGMYATWVHVEDLRRRGVAFVAPCVNRSQAESTLEGSLTRGPVRLGLGRVFGLADSTITRTLEARAERPFRSLADVIDRGRPSLPELEALILAGALDFTGRTRPSLLLEARVTPAPAAARVPALVGADGAQLAPEPVAPVTVAELPEFDVAERVRGECQVTGVWFSAHPLEVLVPAGKRAGATPARDVPARAGARVRVVGLPCAMRRVETRQAGAMLFLSLADTTGLVECALFPDALRAFARVVHGQVVSVEGTVDETLGACTVVVQRAAALA